VLFKLLILLGTISIGPIFDGGGQDDYNNDTSNHSKDLKSGELAEAAFDYRSQQIAKHPTNDPQ